MQMDSVALHDVEALRRHPGMLATKDTAIAELYAQARPSLWRYARRMTGDAADADDIVQEAFYRMVRSDVGALRSRTCNATLFA